MKCKSLKIQPRNQQAVKQSNSSKYKENNRQTDKEELEKFKTTTQNKKTERCVYVPKQNRIQIAHRTRNKHYLNKMCIVFHVSCVYLLRIVNMNSILN